MIKYFCDSCKEIQKEPLILKVELLHKKASARRDLMLCEGCETKISKQIHEVKESLKESKPETSV